MSNTILLPILVYLCHLVANVVLTSEHHRGDYENSHVFEISEVDPYELKAGSTIQRLNDLLVDRTRSNDPDENLDIILVELLSDYKKKNKDKKGIKVKSLFLALRKIKTKHQCDYYSYLVLSKNMIAIGFDTESMTKRKRKELRRIDEIVHYFMNLHVNQCRQIYFQKFDEIKQILEPKMVHRFDLIFEDAIKEITSDAERKNVGLSYVERLFNAVSGKTYMTFSFDLGDIYKALEKLVKGDPDEEFIRPVLNQETGLMTIRRDKFAKLYYQNLLKTCSYMMQKLGPDLFDPAYLDLEIDPDLNENRVDYYETWLKYILCYRHGGFRIRYDSLVFYIEKSPRFNDESSRSQKLR